MRRILEKLTRGEISIEEAEKLIKLSSIDELEEIAKIDSCREYRKGIPEIILASSKTIEDTTKIAIKMANQKGRALVSRAKESNFIAIRSKLGKHMKVTYNERAGIIIIKADNFQIDESKGKIGIMTAGTSDINVAEEAKIIAEEMGCKVITAYDVGIAGVHRLFAPLKLMIKEDVDVLIVIAGMEGALPTVIAGLVDLPVIGVPTSTSYGYGEKGIGALTTMLQSCSLGLAVVNIDNGVAAGSIAALIAKRVRS